MASNTPFIVNQKSQEAIIQYYTTLQEGQNTVRDRDRARFEAIDKQYMRETNKTKEQRRASAANKAGDPNRYQDITVPVVKPQVEAAVVHQASVFLTGHPLFGVVANPTFMDEALQMESVIEEQSIRGGWARQLMMFFRDGFKYNFAPLEVSWESVKTVNLETDIDFSTTEAKPKQTIWTGNKVVRRDPYNTFVDYRVPATEVHKDGEYSGFTELMPRTKLKEFLESLPDGGRVRNNKKAFESGTDGSTNSEASSRNYYIPSVNDEVPESIDRYGETNWDRWLGLDTGSNSIDWKNVYNVTTLYARILPKEFHMSVPGPSTVQIWKFIIVNHEIVVYAERQTNAHNFLPILIGQPNEDGLSYQTKSLAKDAEPFQEVSTTLMAANIASRRRAISDRLLYDPSRVSEAHINSPNPSAKIPVRPAAYGQKVGDSVHRFDYHEDQAANNTAQIRDMIEMANHLNGQNRVTQGQFQKGNKTLAEFDSVMRNAGGRDQMVSILLEYQVFIPMKEMLKLNILQFQGGTTVYNRDKEQAVEIDPVKLRKAVLEFTVTDGLIPAEKAISGENFSVAVQAMSSSPEIASAYNIGPAFSYLMKTKGADLRPFEKSPEQIAYEQAVGAWQQTVIQLMEANPEIKAEQLPPQPTPEQFNYNPQGNNVPQKGAENTAAPKTGAQ
jgi:hypothetical protein